MVNNLKHANLNTPGGRLRFLRSLSGLTRAAIEIKYGLPEVTLKKWETGSLPLSDKGISRCVILYKSEGIIVTESWVKQGVGPLPNFSPGLGLVDFNIEQDLNYFVSSYQNCIIHKIVNEEMLPQYKPGELVIGLKYRGEIKKLHNKDCLVYIKGNEIIFRKLIVLQDATYNLVCTNPLTVINPILYGIKIESIAPVVWHKLT